MLDRYRDYKRGEAYTFHEGFSAHLVGGKDDSFFLWCVCLSVGSQNLGFGSSEQIKSAQSWGESFLKKPGDGGARVEGLSEP